jgi:hypothetical protein
MRDLDELFAAMARSRFRSRFRLGASERAYLEQKGLETVLQHARRFIAERLAPAQPRNDGRQTPLRGHPVFVAQHATATCCRSCLAKWHGIAPGSTIPQEGIEYILLVIERWLAHQTASLSPPIKGFRQGKPARSWPLFGPEEEESG